MDSELIKHIHRQYPYEISDELLGWFLDNMTEIRLKKKEVLLPFGKTDTNVYILKRGIMRYVYFDGEREKTYGFALPGAAMISYHSFYGGEPSFFRNEACTVCDVLKISKSRLNELMRSSHEFATWMFYLSSSQSYYNEKKLSLINGHAKERFGSLIKNRPEIMAHVSSQTIASYLGVTPSYLSFLKKSFKEEKK